MTSTSARLHARRDPLALAEVAMRAAQRRSAHVSPGLRSARPAPAFAVKTRGPHSIGRAESGCSCPRRPRSRGALACAWRPRACGRADQDAFRSATPSARGGRALVEDWPPPIAKRSRTSAYSCVLSASRVPRCCGGFTPSTRASSPGEQTEGGFFFRFCGGSGTR